MRATEINDDELYEMVNLVPRLTGLPMTIWASPRGAARQHLRIKVNRTHGRQMVIAAAATVGVRPTPRLIAGQLSPADLQAVSDWIRLNEAALVGYWDFHHRHRRVSAASAAIVAADPAVNAPHDHHFIPAFTSGSGVIPPKRTS
jgi:hypothetical protein